MLLALIWIGMAGLAGIASVRYLKRIRGWRRSNGVPAVDDEALRRILEEGRLTTDEDEPLDLEEVARAEEEFWSEEWDEPEEYYR